MPYQQVQQRNITYLNVKDFGAQGDGATDDTTAIQAAINAAAGGVTDGTNTTSGGVFFPRGTYLHAGLTLYSFVHLRGAGLNATILKLKNAANADCILGYNAVSLIGGSSSGGIVNWSIMDMIIDGNKANQTTGGYGIRQYGYGFILQNIIIRNTFNDIIRSDWNGGSASSNDSMEAKIVNCKFHDSGTGAFGLNWTGPHDSTISGCEVYKSGVHGIYIGPNATGMKFMSTHVFNCTTGVGAISWLIEATGFQAVNCVAEGSDTCDVVVLAGKFSWVGGSIFCFNTGSPTNNVGGVQIGQIASATLKSAATSSPIALTSVPTTVSGTGAFLQFVVSGASGFNGTIVIVGTALDGSTGETITVTANATYTSVHAYLSTSSITVNTITGYSINVIGLGLPYTGSSFQSAGVTTAVAPVAYSIDSVFSKCEWINGSIWFANDGGNGFVAGPVTLESNANPNKVLTGTVAGSTYVALIPNGVTADGTTGKGGWFRLGINANKALTVTDATSDYFNVNTAGHRTELPNGMGLRQYSDNYSTRTVEISGGTIAVLQSTSAAATASSGTITTSGVGIARIAPTGNITAVILQAGTLAGQRVIVRNESAFTVTFDVAGTSHVADGATSAIPANCSREFEWNSVGAVWSRMA